MTAAPRPITAERYDTGPISVDDDGNEEAARQFRRNALDGGHKVAVDGGLIISPEIIALAQFRETVRARGGTIGGDATEDQRILQAASDTGYDIRATGAPASTPVAPQETTPALPPILDLDATTGESEHKLRIRRRNGDTLTLEPTLTTGGVRMLHWYQGVIERLFARMAICEDEDEAINLNLELEGYREKQLRQVLPMLPAGLCQELSKNADRDLASFVRRVVDLAEGRVEQETSDPN